MTSWADQEEEEQLNREKEAYGITESIDENGIKTVIEIKKDGHGNKVKIIKKVRTYTRTKIINKNIEGRRAWEKFGECTGRPPGLENGITSVSVDDYILQLGARVEGELVAEPMVAGAVCRQCGKSGEHWTSKCPLGDTLDAPAASPDKYQHPNKNSTALGGGWSSDRRRGDEQPTIRVTNLSDETRDADLQELFRPFGPISRIFLAMDRDTNVSKGFAFVSFIYREDAEKAIKKLNGYGYDHLILNVEWAKPSTNS